MHKISTILIPFDFSKASKKALEYSLAFVSRAEDIQITLSYISGNSNFNLLPENFINLEEEYRALFRKKLDWSIQPGNFPQTLLKIQKDEATDLIIMGTFGSNEMNSTKSSNTLKLVLEADCPILVVPSEYKEFYLKNIALVLGKEKINTEKDLEILLSIVQRFNAKVHVISVENKFCSNGYSKNEKMNEGLLAYYFEHFYVERVFIKNKDVAKGIFNYTTKHTMDLIITLSGNHLENSKSRQGKLLELLTLHSKIPVLIMK